MKRNKICPDCKKLLPLSSFYTFQRSGEDDIRHYTYCKKCSCLRSKKASAKRLNILFDGVYYGKYAELDTDAVNQLLEQKGMTYENISFQLHIRRETFERWMFKKAKPRMKSILPLSELLECKPEELILNKPMEKQC